MLYTIEKYKLEKYDQGRYLIKAKVIKRNIFGSITKIYYEQLDSDYCCSHQRKKNSERNLMYPISGKKKAKWVVKTLNQNL